VLRSGGDFGHAYVERLKNAVAANTNVPHKFICLTDMRSQRLEAEGVFCMPLVSDWPAWWAKIEMFRITGSVVYFDLDTVITGSIDGLLEASLCSEDRFIMRRNFKKAVWSSNVMAWSGDYRWLVESMRSYAKPRFRRRRSAVNLIADSRSYRGDQDWIAAKLEENSIAIETAQSVLPGIYSYKKDIVVRNNGIPENASVIVFHGVPRPHEVRNPQRWLTDNWHNLGSTEVLTCESKIVEEPKERSEAVSRRIRAARSHVRSDRVRQTGFREWRPPLRRMFKPVPKVWCADTVYILGGGPSLRNCDISQLNGRHVIAVNNSYKLAYFAEVLFFGDCWWFEAHRTHLESFPGIIMTTCQYEIKAFPRVIHLRHKLNRFGLSGTRQYVTWNLNAGACAVDLAVNMGAKTIVLLGYDMKQIDGRNNWHSDHRTSNDPGHNPYGEFLLAWPYIAHDAQRMGVKIINATPGSALDLFPVRKPSQILEALA
jgi:hypothetical protein